jgi:hypothetical protein
LRCLVFHGKIQGDNRCPFSCYTFAYSPLCLLLNLLYLLNFRLFTTSPSRLFSNTPLHPLAFLPLMFINITYTSPCTRKKQTSLVLSHQPSYLPKQKTYLYLIIAITRYTQICITYNIKTTSILKQEDNDS